MRSEEVYKMNSKQKEKVILVLKYIALIFFSFVAVLPIVSCVVTAFKTEEEYNNTNVMTLPKSWLYFKNFTDRYLISKIF